MLNYWCCDLWLYDDDGSWFGLRATAERLRRTQIGLRKIKTKLFEVIFIGACVSSSVRRHVSSTGM